MWILMVHMNHDSWMWLSFLHVVIIFINCSVIINLGECCNVKHQFPQNYVLQISGLKFWIRKIKIISFTKDLDKSTENYVFTKQIIRSASSVASNYRAACRGRSKAEFYAKLSIVIEEADETLFWLEMIEEFNDKQKLKIIELFNEGEELLKIFSKSRKTMNASK